MADKDFKVKTGLDLPAPLPVTEGGTGQTSVENTRNALMPTQSGHSGKFITTDGTNMSWAVAPQQTATDGAAGYKVYAGNTTPTGQNVGDIWIDGTTGNGIQLVRWRKTISSATSTISGLDDNNLTLTYTAGNEQVYINGVLITRGQDYTATNGTSISLTQAVEVGDTVEIFGNPLFSVTDTYTQAQAQSVFTPNTNTYYAGKNKIINGDMSISQRNTSFSGLTSGTSDGMCLDRYSISMSSVGTWTVSQDNDVPTGIGVAKSMKWLCTSANSSLSSSSLLIVRQRIEQIMLNSLNYGTSNALPVTVSFWVKSNLTGTYNLQVYNPLPTARSYNIQYTISNQNTWEKKTIVVPGDTVAGITGAYLAFDFWLAAGSNWQGTSGGSWATNIGTNAANGNVNLANAINNYWSMTALQVEIGSVATAFSTNTANPQSELAACQRYYWRSEYGTRVGIISTTTSTMFSGNNPTTMRIAPSLSTTMTNANYGSTWQVVNPGIAAATKTGTINVISNSSSPIFWNIYLYGHTWNLTPTALEFITNAAYIEASAEL